MVRPPTREARVETASAKSWGLGSLAGHAPFESKTGNAQETYGLVKRGIETVHFPGTVNLQAGVLVTWGRSGLDFDQMFWNENNVQYGTLMVVLFSTQTMYPNQNDDDMLFALVMLILN